MTSADPFLPSGVGEAQVTQLQTFAVGMTISSFGVQPTFQRARPDLCEFETSAWKTATQKTSRPAVSSIYSCCLCCASWAFSSDEGRPRRRLVAHESRLGVQNGRDFRVYLANQQSLTKFLVHCCLQPESCKGSDALAIQRAASRCLANLGVLSSGRSAKLEVMGLKGLHGSTQDLTVRAYLGIALGIEHRGHF
eukprot:s118_g10.t1